MTIQMRTNTKKFKLLEFIGTVRTGVRYGEIERFICEMNGYDYDQKVSVRQWTGKSNEIKFAMVRRHKGIWATNLTSGKDCILRKYCVKNEKKQWVLNAETQQWIDTFDKVPTSSLESVTATDTIKGNSVPVSLQHIRLDISQERKFEALVPYEKTEKEKLQEAIDSLQALRAKEEAIKWQIYSQNQQLQENQKQQDTAKAFIRNFLGL